MKDPGFNITEITEADRQEVGRFVARSWGSSLSVSRGRVYDTKGLPGFICRQGQTIAGLVTYHIENNECEIITLDSLVKNKGFGTALLYKVIEKAKNQKCNRVWLITTNDNTNAIGFYQKRGFEWAGFYRDAMEESRKLKPQIPEYGHGNIPIKHELEFEYRFEAKLIKH